MPTLFAGSDAFDVYELVDADEHDPVFVQRQLGHVYESTTSIYTHVSEDFANRLLQAALANVPGLNSLEMTP